MSRRRRETWLVWACLAAALPAGGCRREQPGGPAPAAGPNAGDVVANCVGMKLAYVPPGEFVMGSDANEPGRHDDERPCRVTIGHGFHLGLTEVTQAQWQAVMGFNRSEVAGDDLPASRLSWAHAVDFCRKLSGKDGRSYRLPTEAEWEYACRAGAAGAFGGTGRLDEMGWHMDNSGEAPHAVAQKKPNAWGLYDMHGNVAEWCADWYERDYPPAPTTDPKGPAEGKYRVARGGSWGHFARACRSAARASFNPAYQLQRVGLRVVLETAKRRERDYGTQRMKRMKREYALARHLPASSSPHLFIPESLNLRIPLSSLVFLFSLAPTPGTGDRP